MDIFHRISSVLQFKIIDPEKRISRRMAYATVCLAAVITALAGYYIGLRWFWVDDKNVYEYRIYELKKYLRDRSASSALGSELALNYYLQGNTRKAVAILRDILSKEPDNDTAALFLGLIYSEQQEHQKAIELLTGYVNDHNGIETRIAYLYLGRDHFLTGNYSLALKYLEEARKKDSASPVVYYYLGQTHEKLGEKEKAIDCYEKALAIAGDYIEAERALKELIAGGSASGDHK